MRHRALRHIASILLLAIYLPTMVLSSLHVHHETIDTHDDCLQCAGHFETRHHHEHDCLYCHFLDLDCLGQATAQSTFIPPATDRCTAIIAEKPVMTRVGVSLLRAPPTA